ncbi:MAG: ribosomal protein methyltransferase [Verrucomicrobiota bacterium]|jgi:ribosomal protein L11 methyltransferase
MYIWRKSSTTDWIRTRSEDLSRRFGSAIAIIEQAGKARTLVEISCPSEREARALIREFGGSVERLRRDWLAHFARRARAKPLRVGSRLVILRTQKKQMLTSKRRPLVIPAEAAFGTGEHATTAMCLRLLERGTRRLPPGWAMLDAGTGSGVLALAGSCFGAKRIVAIDLDPLACATAKRNARANRIRNVEFITGDVLKEKLRGKFDLITANLFSQILIDALPTWSRRLASDGCLILSGILRSQEKAMGRALKQNGFNVSEIRRRGKWVALLALPRTGQRAVPTRKKS